MKAFHGNSSDTPCSRRRFRLSIFLADLQGGGAERASVNLANAFVGKGYSVDMVLLQQRGDLMSKLHEEVRVVSLGAPRIRNALLPLARYLKLARPDAMLASVWPLSLIAVWARMLYQPRMRLVISEHTTWSQSDLVSGRLRRALVRGSMRLFFPLADGIAAVSKGAARDLEAFARLAAGAVHVVYNPVLDASAEQYLPAPPLEPAHWCTGNHYRVLAVGNLKVEKDYHTLLDSFAGLVKNVNARLLILGEGPFRQSLEERASALGIGDRVTMPGYAPDPLPYFRHAHLHVLSSKTEALPTVVIEALAMGTPVVCTDCPHGPSEILEGGAFGRLVPVGDVPALTNAMADALRSPVDPLALRRRANDFSVGPALNSYERLLFGAVRDKEVQT